MGYTFSLQVPLEADPIPWASSLETCCHKCLPASIWGWRKHCERCCSEPLVLHPWFLRRVALWKANVSTVLSPPATAEELTPFQACPKSTCKQVLCLMAEPPLLCCWKESCGQAVWQESEWENAGCGFTGASHSRWVEHFNKSSEQMS